MNSPKISLPPLLATLLFFVLSFIGQGAHAHVKWFSAYGFNLEPLALSQVFGPSFWGLLALSLFSLPLLLFLDGRLETASWYKGVNRYLDRFSGHSTLILRVTVAILLLLSWQGDTMIAPEIKIPSPFWGWLQFFMALLLLTPKTTPLVGLGMLGLYAYGLMTQGGFHLLDYLIFPAVGIYLLLSRIETPKIKELRLPLLYGGLGLSLCWVAFEKLFYPTWGLAVLESQPGLTMGLPAEFFLTATAFVEFTLGYLLIICFLNRPLALIITLVFFTTTLFFGKLEVIGHIILHGSLLVFIVKGTGNYYPVPIKFHKSTFMKSVFICANFALLFGVLLFSYQKMAHMTFHHAQASQDSHQGHSMGGEGNSPEVKMVSAKDSHGGWNLEFKVKNFKFTPENAGKTDVPGEGHAHLYVDGKKVARVYGPWFHLSVPEGSHAVTIELNNNSHKAFQNQGEPVADTVTIVEEKRDKHKHHDHHHH